VKFSAVLVTFVVMFLHVHSAGSATVRGGGGEPPGGSGGETVVGFGPVAVRLTSEPAWHVDET